MLIASSAVPIVTCRNSIDGNAIRAESSLTMIFNEARSRDKSRILRT